MRWVREREGDERTLAYVAHQRGAKAGDAGSAGVADARIDDSGGSSFQQLAAQALRGSIAVRIQIFFVGGIPAQIVKVGAEVGQEFSVDGRFFLLPIDLSKPFERVECNYRLRGLHGK